MPEVRKRMRLWRGIAKLPILAARWSSCAVAISLGMATALAQPPAIAQLASIPPANGMRADAPGRQVSFPMRPLRLIVPFPAGGVADAVARLLAEQLSVRLGVSVEVDNRPGAAGTMAGDLVAKASSDGHTLLFHQANMLIQPGLEPVPYDVMRDFTPVARVAATPLFLVIDGHLPMTTAQQWVTAVRSSPASYSYGYGQAGSPSHLYAEYAVRGMPTSVPLVVAKGESAVVQEMLAGRISACFCSWAAVQSHVRSGALRILGVTGPVRSPLSPQVPTLQEAGMEGYGALAWYGVMAPAKTPREIIDRLQRESSAAVRHPEVAKRLAELGAEAVGSTGAAQEDMLRRQMDQFRPVIREMKID